MSSKVSLYDVYLKAYGKVKSGQKLDDSDYGERGAFFEPYSEKQNTAVSIAVHDSTMGQAPRPKKDLEEEVNRLLG